MDFSQYGRTQELQQEADFSKCYPLLVDAIIESAVSGDFNLKMILLSSYYLMKIL